MLTAIMQSALYKSVVITGANGMLGHALTDALRARGVTPVTLARAECDLARTDDVSRIFEHKPALVLNCAAHTKVDLCEQEPDLAHRVNGHAVGEMAALAKRHGTRIVQVSTDFVFNGQGVAPYRIDEPVAPLSVYGRSKLLGETLLQQEAPPGWMIVRTAWVYGRHGANFPRTMVTVARAGKPLAVVADQVGSPTYTVDLAQGILALLDVDATGIFHVSNAGETNWHRFAQTALAAFDVNHPVSAITSADWVRQKPTAAARPAYSVLDLSRFEQTTGKTMRPWTAALADYAAEVNRSGW